jgi:flagellar motor protein MotB
LQVKKEDAPPRTLNKTLPDGIEMALLEGGTEYRLLESLNATMIPDSGLWIPCDQLQFHVGSSELNLEESTTQLENIALILSAYRKYSITVGGFTSADGETALQMSLSQQRAQVVSNELVLLGIDGSRISAVGYGPQKPVMHDQKPVRLDGIALRLEPMNQGAIR